jgi:formamidopyrimidine-DNA glycosylase
MMRIGFVNKDLSEFESITGKTVNDVVSRGNTIRVKLSGSMNLLLAPEYGGVISFIQSGMAPKYHLKLAFRDSSRLTVRVTSMGVIYALPDEKLKDSYMYRRDFLGGVSPDAPEYTWEWFKKTVGSENKQLKPLLVGKDAHLIGISNATFQDVIYRAGVHPKRRASGLSESELRALYDAIKYVVDERLRLGGKDEFTDIPGVSGRYVSAMGPNMKDKTCPRCGSKIEKIAHGGGHVYLCPVCQAEK